MAPLYFCLGCIAAEREGSLSRHHKRHLYLYAMYPAYFGSFKPRLAATLLRTPSAPTKIGARNCSPLSKLTLTPGTATRSLQIHG